MTGQTVWRNLFHFSGIVIPLACLFLGKAAALALSAVLLSASVVVEVLRIKGRLRLTFLEKNIKEKERKAPTGSFFFLLGAMATLALFNERAAVPALFILAVSDPLSSLVGRHFGKTRFLGKSLEGTCVFFLSSLAVLLFFSLSLSHILLVALAATAAELFTRKPLDDNVSIPIVSAAVLTLLGR
jgi:dolichol kinase